MATSAKKRRAASLLRRYDALRREMRKIEPVLAAAVSDYGREAGYYGLSKDHFRNMLEQEASNTQEQAHV